MMSQWQITVDEQEVIIEEENDHLEGFKDYLTISYEVDHAF